MSRLQRKGVKVPFERKPVKKRAKREFVTYKNKKYFVNSKGKLDLFEKGIGEITDIEGLEIGGKTGTSQIARGGKYHKRYISSFFGFSNDKNSKYTIGVTVFEPSWKYHFQDRAQALLLYLNLRL